jgi:hypothetical protein
MNIETQTGGGACTCGHVRYEVVGDPLIVHGCHCRGCQKNSGSAFAVNALFEADRVMLLSGDIEEITVPTPGGTGQDITRCVNCKVAVWSNYNMGGPLRKLIRFIRVGTLDEPDKMPPNVHIYTCSKQPWVVLPKNSGQFDEIYVFDKAWQPNSIERLATLKKAAGI